MKNITLRIAKIYEDLRDKVNALTFSAPVMHVYNPLNYAWDGFAKYIRLTSGHARAVFLGMNPGPWGMAQTGVPFGEIESVRNFLGIREIIVTHPENEQPSYPVEGLECKRSEISGKRLWNLFRKRYENAAKFFRDNFVLNYCPLLFLAEGAKINSLRNLTPDKLKKNEREKLFFICNEALRDAINILQPDFVIGIGSFSEARAKEALKSFNDIRIIKILHPSPASPASNKDWDIKVTEELIKSGVWNNEL